MKNVREKYTFNEKMLKNTDRLTYKLNGKRSVLLINFY